MTSIGETLRRERLRRNLDYHQISRALKINPRMLEAIEADEFEKLPGTVFAKSFVRQYAGYLGLDEEEMAAEVQKLLAPTPAELPRFAQQQEPSTAPIQVPKVEEWETVGDRTGFKWSSPLPALALFVVVLLACSGVYAWYQRARHTATPQAGASDRVSAASSQPQPQAPPTTVAAQPPESTPPAESAPVPVTPTPSPLTAANTTPPAPVTPPPAPANPIARTETAPNPNATVHIQITADEAAWVLVRADGKYLFSGTLDANQTRMVDAEKNVELRLGNAGGVEVRFNGNAIGPVGPKGQVRTVQFTSGGFQIVAAPKSAPLIDPPLIDPPL